jgi:5'-nucleotidase
MRPLILITNDDGADAPGIQVLTNLMKPLGDVVVVAPDGPRSGQSNALTVNDPIRCRLTVDTEDYKHYICTGTPTDCVKLALNQIVDRKPDLLVSGINHGSNAGINVIYSGTMGAVLEGCEHDILSLGFSINCHANNVDFSNFEPYILQITKEAMNKKLNHAVCLNINAPVGEIKGIKVARQCDGRWTKEYEKYIDPHGRPYYWLTGEFENYEPLATDTDEWALNNGYVSVVPVSIDMTAHSMIGALRSWSL